MESESISLMNSSRNNSLSGIVSLANHNYPEETRTEKSKVEFTNRNFPKQFANVAVFSLNDIATI